ncbi:MAG: hypothetical protein WCD52_00110 [Xanthobacteraceae bacterium]
MQASHTKNIIGEINAKVSNKNSRGLSPDANTFWTSYNQQRGIHIARNDSTGEVLQFSPDSKNWEPWRLITDSSGISEALTETALLVIGIPLGVLVAGGAAAWAVSGFGRK